METKVNADPWLSAVQDFIVNAFLHKMSFHTMEYLHQALLIFKWTAWFCT